MRTLQKPMQRWRLRTVNPSALKTRNSPIAGTRQVQVRYRCGDSAWPVAALELTTLFYKENTRMLFAMPGKNVDAILEK